MFGTSGLHVFGRDVSIHCMGESWRFFTTIQDFFVSNLIQKSYVPRALRFSCQGQPAKRSEKGYGEGNMISHSNKTRIVLFHS